MALSGEAAALVARYVDGRAPPAAFEAALLTARMRRLAPSRPRNRDGGGIHGSNLVSKPRVACALVGPHCALLCA